MKEKIINDILNLKSGEEFSLKEIFLKNNIDEAEINFGLCFEIVKDLSNNIEPKLKPVEGKFAVVGTPENIRYIKK